jgi:uncharacterized Ntn-hydrolase superfamily protein
MGDVTVFTSRGQPLVSTFSIVARDALTGDLGIAVQSKFLAVGAVVPWARAGVGAVATQARANVAWGPRGLELMAQGLSAREAMDRLTSEDEGAAERQCGMVDAHGQAATFTGPDCMPWAGGVAGDGFCCQGNILVGPDVVGAMADAFRTGTTPFADRLIAALEAGQAAGGDSRGKESASLLIVRERGGYGGNNDRYIDLRVDDHPEPIHELRRILRLHEIYFGHRETTIVALDADRITLAQSQLRRLGDLAGDHTGLDVATRAALERFIGRENLEERTFEGNQIDSVILDFLTVRSDEAAERDAAGP